jgi:uncharacterized protein (UPF0332 family)
VANAPAGHWRLQKAERFMRAATRALDADDLETAVSRAYYARFHATIALLEIKVNMQRGRWDHDQVRMQFRNRFANQSFVFTRRDADDMDKLYEQRLQADYRRPTLRRRETELSIQAASTFVRRAVQEVSDA